MKPLLSHIVAMTPNRVIGRGNDLPWRIPEDLGYFKRTTLGKPVLMGRRTHESIGRPLPGRRNIVLSRRTGYEAAGCEVVGGLDEALRRCGEVAEIVVIGGEELYRLTLDRADRIYLTRVFEEVVDGDTWYPAIDPADWVETPVERGKVCEWVRLDRAP